MHWSRTTFLVGALFPAPACSSSDGTASLSAASSSPLPPEIASAPASRASAHAFGSVLPAEDFPTAVPDANVKQNEATVEGVKFQVIECAVPYPKAFAPSFTALAPIARKKAELDKCVDPPALTRIELTVKKKSIKVQVLSATGTTLQCVAKLIVSQAYSTDMTCLFTLDLGTPKK